MFTSVFVFLLDFCERFEIALSCSSMDLADWIMIDILKVDLLIVNLGGPDWRLLEN